MNKEEHTANYGEEAYLAFRERSRKADKKWKELHPKTVRAQSHERGRKGGRYYRQHLSYQGTGLPRERNNIRRMHSRIWSKYKKLVAPATQIHHEWLSGTAKYRGVALVEKNAHQHGFIDVIQILDGTIIVLTEAELKQK